MLSHEQGGGGRMSEIKLKPCPFCGGSAELYKVWSGYSVKCCGNERCHMQAVPLPAYETKERAVEAWNRRAK